MPEAAVYEDSDLSLGEREIRAHRSRNTIADRKVDAEPEAHLVQQASHGSFRTRIAPTIRAHIGASRGRSGGSRHLDRHGADRSESSANGRPTVPPGVAVLT